MYDFVHGIFYILPDVIRNGSGIIEVFMIK